MVCDIRTRTFESCKLALIRDETKLKQKKICINIIFVYIGKDTITEYLTPNVKLSQIKDLRIIDLNIDLKKKKKDENDSKEDSKEENETEWWEEDDAIKYKKFEWLSKQDLYETLKKKNKENEDTKTDIIVIDVRGPDFYSKPYKIKYAENHPKHTIFDREGKLIEFVTNFCHFDTIVFHCMYSQFRGPQSANAYVETKNTMQSELKQNEKVPFNGDQKVYVLEHGFDGFWREYGNNEDDLSLVFEQIPPQNDPIKQKHARLFADA